MPLEGYWEDDSSAKLREWVDVHQIPKTSIHTSGHASPSDLKRFGEALAPKVIVPIHTSAPDAFGDLFNNVRKHPDGEYWEV